MANRLTRISDHFPNILQKFFKGHTIVFQRLPKIAEDFWEKSEDISNIHRQIKVAQNSFQHLDFDGSLQNDRDS